MIGTPQTGFAGTEICAERYMSPEPSSTSALDRAKTTAGERVRAEAMDVLYSLAL